MNRGRASNIPLERPGPKRRGICLIKVSEAIKASYLRASFLMSFLFLLSFFKSSEDIASTPWCFALSISCWSPRTLDMTASADDFLSHQHQWDAPNGHPRPGHTRQFDSAAETLICKEDFGGSAFLSDGHIGLRRGREKPAKGFTWRSYHAEGHNSWGRFEARRSPENFVSSPPESISGGLGRWYALRLWMIY